MPEINVLVLDISSDLMAKLIAREVIARPDMNLIFGAKGPCLELDEVEPVLRSRVSSGPCALILVGRTSELREPTPSWLDVRKDLVVMHVHVIDDDIVEIGFRNSGVELESLLAALRDLIDRIGTRRQERGRVVNIQLHQAPPPPEDPAGSYEESNGHSLFAAAVEWLRALLYKGVSEIPNDYTGTQGFEVTRETSAAILKSLAPVEVPDEQQPLSLADSETTLDALLDAADENPEPLARAVSTFPLGPTEFRILILTLAPEIDLRFQRCFGFLLDDMSRRVGTIGLFASLLKIAPADRGAFTGHSLIRWLVFEDFAARPVAADEPLRVDPFLAQWLIGAHTALTNDPRVRRVLRMEPWAGANLLERPEESAIASRLIAKIKSYSSSRWLLLDGNDAPAWRALIELACRTNQIAPVRVEPSRLAGLDIVDVEECARRIARLTRLTGAPLIVDLTRVESLDAEEDRLTVFLATLDRLNSRAALICHDEARIVTLLATQPFESEHELTLPASSRLAAVRAAAVQAGAYLSSDVTDAIANRYPLHIDGLEEGVRLALSRPKNFTVEDPALDRLITAFKELAAEGMSHLVDRIEPLFSLEQVILPPDRKLQLIEIVDNIRLASRVLDEWKFREQLPYGRGVSALFSGPSGTGKTMAAMGIAKRLDIQILRLDLSKVVSKYIGDTEKNIQRVFAAAENSGAAILIDEADALLGKRSEVKDAHDRYANIEVAFLLQRMEAYDGLAILTTNMRKNLDAAFLRRLRFIVDFPKPDVDAREKIWRQCLPEGSRDLTDIDFRQLARRLDITGGQIRQITLRAAFIGAAADSRIKLEHIAQAARAELAKVGMPPVELDFKEARRAA